MSKEEQFVEYIKNLSFSDAIKFYNAMTPSGFHMYDPRDEDDAVGIIRLWGVKTFERCHPGYNNNEQRAMLVEMDETKSYVNPHEELLEIKDIITEVIRDADGKQYDTLYTMFPGAFKIWRNENRKYYVEVYATIKRIVPTMAPCPRRAEAMVKEDMKDLDKVKELFPELRNEYIETRVKGEFCF